MAKAFRYAGPDEDPWAADAGENLARCPVIRRLADVR